MHGTAGGGRVQLIGRLHMSERTSQQSDDIRRLIDGHLDGTLSPEESARLEFLLVEDAHVAAELARAALLDDRLRAAFRVDASVATDGSPAVAAGPRRARGWLAIAAVVAASILVAAWVRQPTASAASVALERIVAAAGAARDREYRISVLDHGLDGPPPVVMSAGRGRKPGVDGSRLFVRGDDRFVLIRTFGDGSEFVTGSDGSIGWAVPPKGPVHVSHDTRRFRRGVPGENEEVPFLDLRSGFDGLRRGYDLSLTEGQGGGSRLEAVRRGPRRRGPERVNVWFNADGVATRIEIAGLPAGDGMPRAVALELVSQREVDAGFFGHGFHHAADRPIAWE